MIDTIRGYINITDKSYSDLEHLFNNKRVSEKERGYKISFNISNFKITITFDEKNKPIRLFFYGSLTKFYLGNNLAQLDLDTTKEAIQMLSDNLNLDISKATLTRIDLGINLILKKPIYHYTSCLLDTKRLKWQRHKESITFFSKSGSKSLTFYDKLEEMKNRSKTDYKTIPQLYRNQNILRYEIRLKRLLKDRLGMETVKVKHLFNDTVQNKLAEIWLTEYEKVNKFSIGIDPLYLLNERNGLYKHLAYHGVERLGHDKIMNRISDLKFSIKNPSSKRSKIKYSLNELLKEVKESTLDENLVAEMDNQIKFIQAFI